MLHPPNGGPAHRGCHVSDLIGVPGRLHANVAIGALQIRSNSVMNNASSGPPNFSVLSLKSMHENCSGGTSGLCFCGDTATCIVQDEPPADGPPSRVYFTRRTPAASRRPSHAWPACWPSHASCSVSSCFPCDLRLPLRL